MESHVVAFLHASRFGSDGNRRYQFAFDGRRRQKLFAFATTSGDSNGAPNVFEKVLGQVGMIETPQADARKTSCSEQQIAIEYWNKTSRSAPPAMGQKHPRDAFDRNLNEIDQAVSEYNQILAGKSAGRNFQRNARLGFKRKNGASATNFPNYKCSHL